MNPGLHLAGQLSIALDECLKTGRIQLRVDMKPSIFIQPMDEGRQSGKRALLHDVDVTLSIIHFASEGDHGTSLKVFRFIGDRPTSRVECRGCSTFLGCPWHQQHATSWTC